MNRNLLDDADERRKEVTREKRVREFKKSAMTLSIFYVTEF